MMRYAALAVAALLLIAAGDRRSGYDDASPDTRAMQDDDAANPAFLWVKQGEALWSEPAGTQGKSCADCHGNPASLRGAATHYPAFDPKRGRIVTLEQRINFCRTDHMGAPALRLGRRRAAQPARLPGRSAIARPAARCRTARTLPVAKGAALFRERMGQLNLSCAQCHEDRAGQSLGGGVIPQGHANGYPEYRLEWQGLGSFYRRLRNCIVGVRAEPFPPDSSEAAALALFLAVRANGMRIETPSSPCRP